MPKRSDNTGVYVVRIASPDQAAEVAQAIDREFRNTLAETLTETEKAFQLGFVAMTEAIVVAIRIVSFLVIFIILAVMANTMAMTARERTSEYATLKALGFGPGFLGRLIFGESLVIAAVGGARRHRAHVPGGERVRGEDGHAVPGVQRLPGDDLDAGRRGDRRRLRGRHRAGGARGPRSHRRRPARDRMKPPR